MKPKKKKEKKKWFWQVFGVIFLSWLMVFVGSYTEPGCKLIQDKIDEQINILVNQVKQEERITEDDQLDKKNNGRLQSLIEEKLKNAPVFFAFPPLPTTYPDWQWEIAMRHRMMDRSFYAAHAFKKYHIYFSRINKERALEAEAKEIRSFKEANQYKTAKELAEEYLDNYRLAPIEPWYSEVTKMLESINMMPQSKVFDNVVY